MTNPQLRAEAVRVTRRLEAQRDARRGRHEVSRPHLNEPATGNIDVSHVINGRREIRRRLDVLRPLIIQSPSEPRAESPPTRRINPGSHQELNRIVRQRVWSATAYILGRTKLSNALEV